MEDFNLVMSLWSLAASALGALIAGFYGVRFGLNRHRGERAFDRRLRWYEQMVTTIQVLVNRTSAFQFFIDEGDVSEDTVSDLLKEISKLSFQVQELSALADLYATPETAEIVRQMISVLNSLGPKLVGNPPNPDANETRRAASQKSMAIMLKAAEFLSRDVRQHLALERLERHQKLPRFRPRAPLRLWRRMRESTESQKSWA